MENKKIATAGIIAALGASLCCITPVLALIAGVGGMASTFAWLDPFRPYLILFTVGVLSFAWYQKLRPQAVTPSCACEEDQAKQPFSQSKAFLGLVTGLALLLLAFPYYSSAFLSEPTHQGAIKTLPEGLQQARLSIKGMTCGGCESSVNHALADKNGVLDAKASYEAGTAEVIFDPALITPGALKKAIEEEVGYQVTGIELINHN